MRTFLLGIIGAGFMLAAFAGGTWWQRSQSDGRYEISTANGALPLTFVLNHKTGRVWRYYMNFGAENKLINDGLQDVIYSDPPAELKKDMQRNPTIVRR